MYMRKTLLTGTDGPVLFKMTTVAVAARVVDSPPPIVLSVLSCFLHKDNVYQC